MSSDSESEQYRARRARAYDREPLDSNDPYRNTSLEAQGSTADTSNFDEEAPHRHHHDDRSTQYYTKRDQTPTTSRRRGSTRPVPPGSRSKSQATPTNLTAQEWSGSEGGGFGRLRSVDEVRSRRERRGLGLRGDGEEDEGDDEHAANVPAASSGGDEAEGASAESSSGDEEVQEGRAFVARPVDDDGESVGNKADDEAD